MIELMELQANIHLEDGSYWADIPELPGCFASGETLDELVDSLLEGVRLYLADGESPSHEPFQIKAAVLTDAVSA